MPTPKTLTETDVLAISDAAGDPTWLRDRRLEAFKAFSDLEWPTGRDEDWRFTNPRRLDLDREVGAATVAITAPDGVVATDLVTAAAEHADVVQAHLGTVVPSEEKFAALALAGFGGGAFVHVPADAEVADPIEIRVDAGDGTAIRWVLVVVERHAKATVLITGSGAGETTVVDAVEAVVGDGATLNLVTTQDWGAGVAHVTTHRGKVGRDAHYQHTEVSLGGDTVYVRPDVWLAGKGGDAEMLGVYFPTGEEKVEHRSLIFHDADHTTSEYVHKGALSDTAHATWYGNIRIDVDAKQTVSDETNRNLILSPGARADTLPFLEIETADVAGCGHHSSVGQVDEVHLWYLQSRGIPRDEAARMLVFAFFTDVLDRVDAPGVEEKVLADITDAIRSAPVTLMDPRRTAGASRSTGGAIDVGSHDAGAGPANFGGAPA
ncbi:Fe-S cluster assembly protein SufD [Euzebya sp.]|uniref:Fe-S cluster assembly protein SufD n=1 Tax=Euzebya sp. TaxID=1971409 RepID=UPI0035154972